MLGKTILAVDDDGDILRLIRAILQRSGFKVLTASGAEEALGIVRSASELPDLLLTDVVMPGMSGPALAEKLLLEAPTLRVLFISGFDNRQIVKHYVVGPGFPLLPKPFTYESLVAKVHEVLSQPQELRT